MTKKEKAEILLIEDNHDHAELAKKALLEFRDNFEVISVSTGKEGKELMDRKSFSAVLLDYFLPGEDGLVTLKQLKQSKFSAPIIVVTGQKEVEIAIEIMKEGAYDYVVKDFSYQNTLPMVIDRVIDRYNAKEEKEKLEKELRESNKKLKKMYTIKSDFTSMVSHELRTPLTAIKEGIAIVLDGLVGEINEKQKDCLDTAKRNVDRLKRLIDEVLDFSKLESKKMIFKIQKGAINEIIKEVVNIQKAVAEEKSLFLDVKLNSSLPTIEFDPDKIIQVLNNLIGNAIKFTKTGGITISTIKDEKKNIIRVSVKDTGEGIKKEDLSKLFQKFQQLEGLNQRKTGGTGLGLAISKEIIEQHGGRIWVESEYGKGAEFKFDLPLKKKYKILVVDDEKTTLNVFEKLLKRNGYIVLRSEKGIEGVQMAQTGKPNLIVLDMRLKDISGYEVIGRLRSNKETSNIPVLAVSGYMDEIERIRSKEEELALPYISKPFDNEEFILKVKLLLRR